MQITLTISRSQKRPNKEMMSSAVIEYDGESLDAIHDQVIRSKNPE